MEYTIEVTGKFIKDLKLARKRNLNEEKLNVVIKMLSQGEKLPAIYKDHSLIGRYKGYRECHISPDWLLIYSKTEVLKIIKLVRTGTHADLF